LYLRRLEGKISFFKAGLGDRFTIFKNLKIGLLEPCGRLPRLVRGTDPYTDIGNGDLRVLSEGRPTEENQEHAEDASHIDCIINYL
jgi:hypothetical protein